LVEHADSAASEASAAAARARSRADDRADIFTLERGQHLAGFESIDDLQLLAPLRARQVLDDDALEHDVGLAARDELDGRDRRNMGRGRVLLGIVGVEAVLILDEQRAPRAEELGRQKYAGVGAVRRDPAALLALLPVAERRHAAHDRDATHLQ